MKANLVHDITVNHNNHIANGFIGTKYLMELLPLIGQNELAFMLLEQTTYPSWGYLILEHGAISVWEYWDPRRSRNHPPYCSVGGYMYKYLAGIQLKSDHSGFKKVTIDPYIPDSLMWVEASYNSVRGPVASRWEKKI